MRKVDFASCSLKPSAVGEITGFRGIHAEDFMAGKRIEEFQAFERQAARALIKLQAATWLIDLRHLPSNRFEALSGNRKRAIQHPHQRPMERLFRLGRYWGDFRGHGPTAASG
jgi:plasmid maintenance system killer protein